MDYLSRLSFGFNKKLPVILQTEVAECGLACLTSILSYYGFHTDLRTLRQKYTLSLKGANLADIMRFGNEMNLTPRALRLELDELSNLQLPCILHWNLNHFVVLCSISKDSIVIMDPAVGMRKIKMDEVSQKFTGIALELFPNTHFEEKKETKKIKILSLLRGISGLKRYLIQMLILAISLEVFALVSPFFMQWVIDHVIVTADKNLLLTLTLGFGLLAILQQLISLLQAWVGMHLSTTLNLQWKANIFKRLLDLPNDYFSKRHLGDVISRFGSIDHIQETLTSTFFVLVLNSLMAVFTFVLMTIYSTQLSLIVLLTLVLYILIRWLAYYPLRNATEENIVHEAKQNSYFMETIRGIQSVKLFDKHYQRHGTWMSLFVNTVNTKLTTDKLSALFEFSNKLLFSMENIIIIYLGASAILDGSFTVGVLMAFLAYKGQFESRTASLVDQYIQIKMLGLHAERLADITLNETETEIIKYNHIPKLDNEQLVLKVENVSFRYADNEPYLFENINLEFKDNEAVVLTGQSGRGKSTLLNILTGSLKPETGTVSINGHDIYQVSPSFIRGLSGIVRQDDVLFAGSIGENISFFDESPNMELIEQCAKMAQIHDDILKMPMGYETLIGDMGNILSGGQKQRVILARALYKRPKILFLDEASSHLDVENEQKINHNLKSLGIMKIMVAHRQETIQSADKILNLG